MIRNTTTSNEYETTGECFFLQEEELFLGVSYIWEEWETETVSFKVQDDTFLNDNYELIW